MERKNDPAHASAPSPGEAGMSAGFPVEPAAAASTAPANEAEAPGRPAPERHFVHHSYIWLGSLRAIGAFLVAIAVGLASSVPGILLEIRSVGAGACSARSSRSERRSAASCCWAPSSS